jgi:hypothetical protein
MRAAITIRRLDPTTSQLRAIAWRAKNVSTAHRMLCLAMVPDGSDHKILGWFGFIDTRCDYPPSCGKPCRKGSVKIIS